MSAGNWKSLNLLVLVALGGAVAARAVSAQTVHAVQLPEGSEGDQVSVAALMTAGTASGAPASCHHGTGIKSITAITEVYTFGQKVSAVAIEYPADVNPCTLHLNTFTVSDSIYNFRFDPIEDLQKRADRTVTRIYANDKPMVDAWGRSHRGRFVIVELSPNDPGGNTVITSTCPTFMCYVKVNPDLPTQVVQNEDVYAWPGHGAGRRELLAAASPTPRPLTGKTINRFVDEFALDSYVQDGSVLPYAYHLPRHYNPARRYPLVVILPGWGMGYDGANLDVQIAADIPATAWLRPKWTGTREEVIVLAPQNERVGISDEAAIMVALVEDFMRSFRVDQHRVYASTVSWGSTTAWEAMATHPGLFTAALITGGFSVSADQAAKIAAAKTPIWITHGLHDHLLPVDFGRSSVATLRTAYVTAGVDQAEAENLIRYTEFGDEAYSEPDYHAVMGPTYEDTPILQWLLAQRAW